MKRGLLVVAAMAALLLSAWPASAKKDFSGKIGVGADQSIGSSSGSGSSGAGLSVRYWVVPGVNVQAIIQYLSDSRDTMGTEQTFSFFGVSLLGHYALLENEGFELNVGGGLNIQGVSFGSGGMDSSENAISLEIGAGPTWWVTDRFALNLMIGVLFDLSVPDGSSKNYDLFGRTGSDLVGGAGFTVRLN